MIAAAETLSLLLLLCQEDVYIRKIDKVRYIEAVQACKEAESKIETDESTAIDKLTRIIQDPNITEVECNLRIQVSDIYGPPYLFLPYQYRARARISLEKKTSAPAEKKFLLEDAIRDLKFSVGKKVGSSQKLLDAAQAEFAKLSQPPAPTPSPGPAPAPSPLPAIRAKWSPLVADRKFKSARALVEGEGAALPESDRSVLLADTQQACRAYLTEQMRIFRRNWTGVSDLAELQALTRDEFETTFALPDAREIVAPHPGYDWARAHLETLRAARQDKAAVAALLAMAEGAARLEEDGENPWFKLAEGLAFQTLLRDAEKRMTECADAPRARRDALLSEIQTLIGSWTAFLGRLDPAFRTRTESLERHSQTLAAVLERKPRDLAELESEDLRSCFEGFPVADRLLAAEQKFLAREGEAGLTRESRQRLLTLIVAARALRLLGEGKSEDQVRLALRPELEKLSRVGGAVEPDRFGPRLRKVYDSLR
jgi:hypothetical protein